MKRIVVGLDGSDGSREALRWAVAQAKASAAEIDAVLAFDSGMAWIDVGSDYEATWLEHATQGARETLEREIADTLPKPCPVNVHALVVEGAAATVLVERAQGADLLVVGTRGRGGVAGLLLGSVSQRCAEHASCPVVVVPGQPGVARPP